MEGNGLMGSVVARENGVVLRYCHTCHDFEKMTVEEGCRFICQKCGSIATDNWFAQTLFNRKGGKR